MTEKETEIGFKEEKSSCERDIAVQRRLCEFL